jgi:transcriptional regulator with XRE-family HTH domain
MEWVMPYSLREQPVRIEDVIVHLGVEIKAVRYAQMDTQSALSARAGISQSTWSMVENGLAEGIRLETLARIATALGYDLVLRRCDHPEAAGREPPNGRAQRVEGATRIPGTRRLAPGPAWQPRDRW